MAVATRGGIFVSMWKSSANLNRVCWHAALLEQHVSKHRGKALGLMIVLPSAAPPQGAARVEANAVVRRIGPHLRCGVTAALGETLQAQVVRTVMRGIFLVSGNAKRHLVVNTEAEGIESIVALVEASAPSRAELVATLSSLHEAPGTEPVERVS